MNERLDRQSQAELSKQCVRPGVHRAYNSIRLNVGLSDFDTSDPSAAHDEIAHLLMLTNLDAQVAAFAYQRGQIFIWLAIAAQRVEQPCPLITRVQLGPAAAHLIRVNDLKRRA